MDLNALVELNKRYLILFLLFLYSLFFLYFSRNWNFEKLSQALLLSWGKILSFIYIFNFPLLLYFYTFPEANFEIFMRIVVSLYGITYIVLFVFGQVLTLEFFTKMVYYLTGFDLSKKIKLRKRRW